MNKIKVAIPPGYDVAIVEIVLRSNLRDVIDEEYAVEWVEMSDYGGFAFVEGGVANGSRVNTVVRSLAPAMEFLNQKNPHGELLRLSQEIKRDKAKVVAEIERQLAEMDREKHSR